jgi:hypothetical protein
MLDEVVTKQLEEQIKNTKVDKFEPKTPVNELESPPKYENTDGDFERLRESLALKKLSMKKERGYEPSTQSRERLQESINEKI